MHFDSVYSYVYCTISLNILGAWCNTVHVMHVNGESLWNLSPVGFYCEQTRDQHINVFYMFKFVLEVAMWRFLWLTVTNTLVPFLTNREIDHTNILFTPCISVRKHCGFLSGSKEFSDPPPSCCSTNWVIQNRAQTRRRSDSIWLGYYRSGCQTRVQSSSSGMQPATLGQRPTLYSDCRPSTPPPSPNLRPISQQDPRGHFQKQSLSLSSQEVPELIINKLLMSERRIARDCARASDVCMCARRGSKEGSGWRSVQLAVWKTSMTTGTNNKCFGFIWDKTSPRVWKETLTWWFLDGVKRGGYRGEKIKSKFSTGNGVLLRLRQYSPVSAEERRWTNKVIRIRQLGTMNVHKSFYSRLPTF